MSEYIERQAAKLAIVEEGQRSKRYKIGEFWELNRNEAWDAIDSVPSADVAPVKSGRWIIRDNPRTEWYRVTCSECGEDVTAEIRLIGFFPNVSPIWDYCPYCGARMDGEADA